MKSSKTATSYFTLLLAILVLASGTANALTENFEAFGERPESSMCACDLKTDAIMVQNTGDVTSTYTILAGGEAAKWTNLAPQSFYLESGEGKQVDRFIQVPCSARGEYLLNTTIKTLFDLEKVIEQKLTVENCNNIQIIPKFSGTQEECPCTPVQYSFDVINTGRHTEIYQISVEPYSEAISLSTDLLILDPGQKENVDVFINLECGQYGERTFTFNALAEGTGLLGQSDFVLNINKCYDYELAGDEQYSICQGVPNIIPFTLNNKAEIANEYFLTLDSEEGIDWAYTENTTLNAWGGETISSTIMASPPADDEGTHTFTLNALSTRGEEQITKTLVLETEKCYDYQLLDNEEFKAVQCEPTSHTYTIKNIGSREAKYIVEISGNDWLTTSAGEITLAAEEEADITVAGTAPCEALGESTESIYVTIEDINQTYVEDKTLSVYTKEDSYMPEIEIPEIKVDYTGGEAEIKITNTGFREAEYLLSITASDWITIDTDTISLAPGENATVLLQAYPTEDAAKDIYAGEFVARVSGEEIEYAAEFTVEVGEKTNPLIWILAGSTLLIVIVIIVLLLVIRKRKGKQKKEEKKAKEAITIDKKEYRRKKEEKKTRIWPILITIMILAALGAAAYYSFASGLIGGGNRNETQEPEMAEEVPAEITETEPVANETEPTEAIETDTPAPEETDTGVLTNEDITESLITLDRSAIAGEGNILRIANETELNLPLSITNPTDRKARFEVGSQEGSWVTFDRDKITVMPNSTETMNVKIVPDHAALENNDYEIKLNTTLEGKKISYQEELDIIVTKQKSTMGSLLGYWPWLVVGLMALIILLIIIKLVTREKTTQIRESKKAKAEKPTKRKEEKRQTEEREGTSWSGVFMALIILLIVAGVAFWAFNTFIQPAEQATNETQEVAETPIETPAETEQAPVAAENVTLTEPKLTEDDVSESLVTIDRSQIQGEGNTLELEQDQYALPMSIKNPTDRKARFTVSTSNESWIVFDEYKIIVQPESTKTVDMNIIPDKEALEKNDYSVTINTKLEGQKIDYEEQIGFILKDKKRFELGYLAYALIGLILIGIVILITEIAKRRKAHKPVAKAKKTEKKEKDLATINKEIADLRKKTILQLRKTAH